MEGRLLWKKTMEHVYISLFLAACFAHAVRMQDPWEQSLSTLLQDAKAEENVDFGVRACWHFKSENALV